MKNDAENKKNRQTGISNAILQKLLFDWNSCKQYNTNQNVDIALSYKNNCVSKYNFQTHTDYHASIENLKFANFFFVKKRKEKEMNTQKFKRVKYLKYNAFDGTKSCSLERFCLNYFLQNMNLHENPWSVNFFC